MFSVKGLILALCLGACFLALFNAFPDKNVYAYWHDQRIGNYYAVLGKLSSRMGVEQRKTERYKHMYLATEWLRTHMVPGDTLVLPPADYVRHYYEDSYYWTDPRVFYYLTGPSYPAVTWDDTVRGHTGNAFVLLGDNNGIEIRRLRFGANADSIRRIWKEKVVR